MAMALTEKLKVDLGHRKMMKVFSVDGLLNSSQVISPADVGMNFIEVACATWKTITLTGGATQLPSNRYIGSSAGGINIALSCSETGNACILQLWGW